jgi:thiamine pyrophosphokinase
MQRAVIFLNGSIPDLNLARGLLRPGDTILAADGGSLHALALGIVPSVIIGDLDSLTPEVRGLAIQPGMRLIEHPRNKNETDFELVLNHAIEAGFHEILIIAAVGNRLDQTLGNLALLADPRLSKCDVRFDDGLEEAFFSRGSSQILGTSGDVISLIPWGREVTGLTTDGLRWPLLGETLHPNKTRGISNEMLGGTASVSLKSGLLLIVHRRLQ